MGFRVPTPTAISATSSADGILIRRPGPLISAQQQQQGWSQQKIWLNNVLGARCCDK